MPEYFDVVDKNDNVVGRALRSECHKNPKLIHRGVFVIIINRKGEVMIQKRGMKADTNPGRWEFMGEHNKIGESYKSAAIRGLREELGIKKANVRKISKMKISSRRETEFDEIFTCKISEKSRIKINSKEVSEAKFLSTNQLENLMRKKPRPFSSWSIRVFNECRKLL
ncbi:MAG: NUDIX domain-containing protein [Candidatus Aenigmarchaeota archaeon]|nr:NUDIX domain-containing protein [Candidatus Aenigmarchaeota archaeon]